MDIADVRRKNLRRLISDRADGNATRFGALIGRQQSYVSDLLAGRKSFGEKVARAIEVALGLDRGWLDREQQEPGEEAAAKPPNFPISNRKNPPKLTRGHVTISDEALLLETIRQIELFEATHDVRFFRDQKIKAIFAAYEHLEICQRAKASVAQIAAEIEALLASMVNRHDR